MFFVYLCSNPFKVIFAFHSFGVDKIIYQSSNGIEILDLLSYLKQMAGYLLKVLGGKITMFQILLPLYNVIM